MEDDELDMDIDEDADGEGTVGSGVVTMSAGRRRKWTTRDRMILYTWILGVESDKTFKQLQVNRAHVFKKVRYLFMCPSCSHVWHTGC